MSGRGICQDVEKVAFLFTSPVFFFFFKKGFKEDECYCLASRVKKKTCLLGVEETEGWGGGGGGGIRTGGMFI